jgi:hypothetical protein
LCSAARPDPWCSTPITTSDTRSGCSPCSKPLPGSVAAWHAGAKVALIDNGLLAIGYRYRSLAVLDASEDASPLLPEFSRCQDVRTLASLETGSGRTAAADRSSSGITPSTIMSPATERCPSTEIRLGVFFLLSVREPIASHARSLCERGPPEKNGSIFRRTNPRLTRGSFTDKEKHRYGYP